MPVICPGCSRHYTLPSHLLGPAGARICCPACWLTFVLGPDGELAAVLGSPGPADSASQANGSPEPASPANGTAPMGSPVNGSTGAESAPSMPHPIGAPHEGELEFHAVAHRAVQGLDDPPGSLAMAEAEGRLFAEHGPALMSAFEALASEHPGEAIAAAFRDALFEIAGLDLGCAPSTPSSYST